MSRRGLFAFAVLAATLAAFAGDSSQPERFSPATQEQELTPERAKEALLEMMRSKPGRDFGWFDGDIPDKISKMKIEEEEDGWYGWTGAFRFNPSKAIYTFVVRPRPGVRACSFEYEGSFVSKDGRWVATLPKLVSTALQSGQ